MYRLTVRASKEGVAKQLVDLLDDQFWDEEREWTFHDDLRNTNNNLSF